MNEHEGRATWFAYCPHGGGFIYFATEREARDEAQRLLEEQADESPDGWSEATDQICWGRVHGEVEEVGRRPVDRDTDAVDPSCDEIVHYALVDVAPIPPAEEIAAMREVCEAARLAVDVFDSEQRQRAKYGGPIWRRSREIEAVASAIERLDAARKGGAT